MTRQSQAEQPSKSGSKGLLRVAGLPAVSALFAAAPARVERLFFDQRLNIPGQNASRRQFVAIPGLR